MPRVYVTNRSGHDFSAAEKIGEIVFLSEGRMSKYATNNMYRMFSERLKESDASDWLLITGLTVMNNVAAAILGFMHGRINLLIYNEETGDYVKRVVKLDGLIRKEVSGD